LLFSYGLLQIVTKPTRCTHHSATLIDHIITNNSDTDLESFVVTTFMSDHFPVFHIMKSCTKPPPPAYTFVRDFSKRNMAAFNTSLLNVDWSPLYICNDAQLAYNNFHNTFLDLYNIYFPENKIKFNKNFQKLEKWMTTGILTSRREKNRLNSLYLSSPTDSNKSTYINYRNLYNKIVRMAKKLHLDKLFIQYQSNLTKTWQLIHQTINKKPKKNSTIIPFIKVKDKTITDPFEIATEFNEFFASIPINITENILPSDVPPVLPNSNDVPIFKFEDNPLTRSEITDAIKSLKIKKTPDMFGISTFFISKFPLTLSTPLLHVFNLSLMQGIVPQQLKVAKVIPIFKSGEVDCTDNYRPISLLPIFSKILERIVCNRLSTFLDVNNLLSNCQFGFRKDHSTVHPLSQFVNFIAEKLNNKEHALAIFCDIKKAFDCVNHSILIKKLYNLGIRDRELLWFQDYLSNRKQFVYVNGLNSYLTKILIICKFS